MTNAKRFSPSKLSAGVGSAGARHRFSFDERARSEQPVVNRPQQMHGPNLTMRSAPVVLRLLHGEGDQLRDVLLIQRRYDNVLLAICHVRDREPDGWATRKLNLMDNVTRPFVVRTEHRCTPRSLTREQ